MSTLASYLAANPKRLAFRIAVNEHIAQVLAGPKSYFCYHKAPKGYTLPQLLREFQHPIAYCVKDAIDNCLSQMLSDSNEP